MTPLLKNITATFLFLFLSNLTFGQAEKETLDTIEIYKNKTGVGYKTYRRHWFPSSGTFSYTADRINKQDSIVIEDTTAHYFKVYDKRGRLLFEGERKKQTEGDGNSFLRGDIKYYYKSGQLKRIEHWDSEYHRDTCNTSLRISNGFPDPEGSWKYFRKDGTLKKQWDYFIKVYSCEPLHYCVSKQITRFRKNGRQKSVGQKSEYCNKDKKQTVHNSTL